MDAPLLSTNDALNHRLKCGINCCSIATQAHRQENGRADIYPASLLKTLNALVSEPK